MYTRMLLLRLWDRNVPVDVNICVYMCVCEGMVVNSGNWIFFPETFVLIISSTGHGAEWFLWLAGLPVAGLLLYLSLLSGAVRIMCPHA